ncbi:FMN reductase [Thermobispora bispora]|jgi:FMN reductase|uniref:NADPH-dependent FMN reductase n=1 Tax=Thermobispora bispora (strain ATCC 19993 / DSM 43833 / CBS 139.67 / JCM 10125 / KCTC 9307 / NBRC 14880 / R51) TaxID=469371 RepID=D6YAV3_THEBD|nr:NAD(P)H-dependent oxidoreductase [Thermobispora bispora]MBO2474924.1 FMN reductase [Actinomycetales bacterium]MDI9581176.1 NAD(P)H-dependent oxidoreductase [Thermobispora sp.]ADG88320.1 NADPH-dependent FMN reductase [Thermobispora bispora DSM 43833]MBX6167878.1 NAD(P)H-dependent oxidoreductase [Thermobispora bispora]QSI48143.1 NADPH-dependent oxidoreductase [Thermobispora bispora]
MSGIVTLVGNPRAQSKTRAVAVEAAEAIGRHTGLAAEEVVDLSAIAPQLFSPGPSPGVEAALELVAGASVLVVASPTYKASYTGLLKAFLDRLPPNALSGTVALPLLVMGDPRHALAVELHLRPVLVELGATVPTPGLAVVEAELPDLADLLKRWAEQVAPQVTAATERR